MGAIPGKLGFNGGRSYDFLNKPVKIDCNFVVDSTNANGLGLRSLKGAGVKKAYMYSTAPITANPLTSATYSIGLAWIQLQNNYQRYVGGFSGCVSPTYSTPAAINATALTVGKPYMIATVGHAAAGRVTIAPVADVSGSLAGTYFTLQDGYGQTFALWFQVSGVGKAPSVPGAILYPVAISSGAAATAITTALSAVITALPSTASGVYSFTASGGGGATLTCISTVNAPLPGAPADSTVVALQTGFTFASTIYNSNLFCWQGVGLPKGITPAVGAAFIATTTGVSTHGGSTGTAIAAGVSGIQCVEVIGDPNASLASVPQGGSPNTGGWILVQFLAPSITTVTSAFEAPMIPTAPADGTVVGMTFYVEAGSMIVAGE